MSGRYDRVKLDGVDLSSYLKTIPVDPDATDLAPIHDFSDVRDKLIPDGLIAQIAQHFAVDADVAEGIIWAYIAAGDTE